MGLATITPSNAHPGHAVATARLFPGYHSARFGLGLASSWLEQLSACHAFAAKSAHLYGRRTSDLALGPAPYPGLGDARVDALAAGWHA